MGPALPCLVILNPEGQLVRADACKEVLEDPQGQQFPWAEQPSKTSVRSDNLLLWSFLMASWEAAILRGCFALGAQSHRL